MLLNACSKGGVIHSPDLARKMAEMVLEDMEGAAEVMRSRPFSVEDLGDAWHVKANPEATGKNKGEGDWKIIETPWKIILRKPDAQVLALGRSQLETLPKSLLEAPRHAGVEKK